MAMVQDYKPLFPWFGGKSTVADEVWKAFGDIDNYCEPFFGSGAVLFLRPGVDGTETVNDADGFICNLWRSISQFPEQVAEHADWPVNEADLTARHLWLNSGRSGLTEKLMADPEFCDPKIAGWWLWGQAQWIGGGWCAGDGPWSANEDGELVKGETGSGIRRPRPAIVSSQGVHRKRPHMGQKGVHRKMPSVAQRGVVRQMPSMGQQGVHRPETIDFIYEQIKWYSDRLRSVRVCCGDWSRITGPACTYGLGITGVFLDPPYADTADRCTGCYAVDSFQVAHDVREWAIEEGKNKLMRIVLAGYEGEHDMPLDWRVHEWKARGGYAKPGGKGEKNKHRERLWMSPACVEQYGFF